MTQLTEQELQALCNIVAQVQVPVAQAGQFIELINKMSKMIDELRKDTEA